MADSDLEISFGASTQNAEQGIARIKEQMSGLGESIGPIADMFKEFAAAVGVAFSVEAVVGFIEKMGELGESVERTEAILGTTGKETQELGYIATITGGSTQGLATSMERLQLNLQRAQTGTGPAAEALQALGLSAKQLIGLPLPEQMNRIADTVSKFADGGNKTAIVMGLLGRGGAQMIPVLDKGRAGLDELRATAENAGVVINDKTIHALADMQHASVTLSASMNALGAAIAGAFSKSIIQAAEDTTQLVSGLAALVQTGGLTKAMFEQLSASLKIAAVNFEGVMKVMADAVTLSWGQIAGDLKANNAEILAIQKEADDKFLVEAARAKLALMMTMQSGGDGSNKPQAPAMDTNAKTETEAAQKAIDGQVKLWEEWLKKQTVIYDEDAKVFGTSQGKKFELTAAATEKAYQAELTLLQQESQLAGLTVAQRQETLNKISALTAAHDVQMTKLNAESVEAMQKQWEGYFSTIEGAFNSNLRGFLAGTTNLKVATEKAFGDMILKLIEGIESMVGKWIAGQIAMSAATTAGAAARAAAEAAGNSTWLASLLAKALTTIGASSAMTSAEVTANVAPAVGPAAPAVGLAAGVASKAAALSLLPLETGAWEVSGGPALLHPGEMVVPQTFAQGIRDAGGLGGGGGTTNNINISAVDSQSIKNLFQGNSDIINSIVQKGARNNPAAMKGM